MSVSLYAFQPGAPGVPASSGEGVLVSGLLRLLAEAQGAEAPSRKVRATAEWAGGRRGRGLAEWRARAGALTGELARLLADPARRLLLVYPQVPGLADLDDPTLVWLARQTYRALRARRAVTRQRIAVVVQDLPIEMELGRQRAGGPPARGGVRRARGIERALFRAAHRLIVPEGFVDTIREQHGIPGERFRTFRRAIYPPTTPRQPPIDFERGTVNFFYSGRVDLDVAANFREILRSIRNAPGTRLHVCGPGRDSVQEWLSELDVPNVRHHGQLGLAEHDWLAARCDVGLILDPTDNPYNHLTPTLKYSAYLANGLAILATDLRRVADNVRADGAGQAMPIRELAMEVLRWATRPRLWAEAKRNAEAHASVVRSGVELKPWIDEIARGE